MWRSFLTGTLAIAAGNTVITIFEKFVYSTKSLQALHELLLQTGSRTVSGALYPPDLLMQKMLAWACGAFMAGLVIALLQPQHRKHVLGATLLFFILAALVNVTIVPHPSWFAAAVPALFIVPLLGGTQAMALISKVNFVHTTRDDERRAGGGMQPATF